MFRIGSSHITPRLIGSQPHVQRWGLFTSWVSFAFCKVFPHYQRPHNHGSHFITIVLWGKYFENLFNEDGKQIGKRYSRWLIPRIIRKHEYHNVNVIGDGHVYSLHWYIPPMNGDFNIIIRDSVKTDGRRIIKRDQYKL